MATKKGSAKNSPCQMGGLLELLTRPWTMHVLWALSHNGPMRFGVLKRHVEGVSSRVLTERLRTLEGAGFVFRHYEQTIPPAVTYGITERMKDIEKVMVQLDGLAKKWHGESATAAAIRGITPRTGVSAQRAVGVKGLMNVMS